MPYPVYDTGSAGGDPALAEALREAYASAPVDRTILHTLELRHSAFSAPLRVVRDYVDFTAKLEESAPADPLTEVTFVAFAFDFSRPEISSTGVPQIVLEIDNVGRELIAQLDAAMVANESIQVTYREYLSTDVTGPQNDPPIHFTVLSVSADAMRIRATCGFPDLVNRRFPTQNYESDRFPGLVS